MNDKAALRWKFVLDGMAIVRPEMDEDGRVEYMMVETEYSAVKCFSPQEVDAAIDIAMYKARTAMSVYIH